MNQDFQGMDYVYEVYRQKSFSRAARKLMISQPSLSATVKRIEGKIGQELFDRGTTPITLTECGRRYIQAVEAIREIEQDFESYLEDLHGLRAGHLTLGGTNLFASYVLPRLIGEFTRRYPEVEIELMEENTANLEQMLAAGSVDLVIDNFQFDEKIFERYPFGKEYLILTVPRELKVNERLKAYQIPVDDVLNGTYRENGVPAVRLEAFSGEQFLLLKKENDTRERGMRLCREAGFQPSVALDLDQQVTAYNLSCAGMGISFISDTLIRNVPPHTGVIFYRLEGELTGREVYFFRKAGRYMSRAVREFLQLAENCACGTNKKEKGGHGVDSM